MASRDQSRSDESGDHSSLRSEATDALYALVNAARRHMATHPVYRSKPVGFEGSQARLEQEDRIATEDALRAAVQAALSQPSPTVGLGSSSAHPAASRLSPLTAHDAQQKSEGGAS